MNTPVTTAEMSAFKDNHETVIGGKTEVGSDINGKPIYAPNRKERRAIKNVPKGNNRKPTSKTKTRGRRKITLYNKLTKEEKEAGIKLTVKSEFNTIY